jgi:hypothetical protein
MNGSRTTRLARPGRLRLAILGVLLAFPAGALAAAEISGELMVWRKVTLTFDGPATGETTDPNPFLTFRLNVVFTHKNSGRKFLVPGYYAADGHAADSSADRGNKWRVHFVPHAAGGWSYEVSFRKGNYISVSEKVNAGKSAGFMDREYGGFDVVPSGRSGLDHREEGMLEHVGKRYLRFAGSGEYFLKCGADAPENLLACADFDGDFKTDGYGDEYIKTWEPHVMDWKEKDPTWRDGKGKGIIGALNYLAGKGMNAISFLTMNIQGDDKNVFPYTHYGERERFDVSKLDQWEIVFDHADGRGLFLHFKTQEAENQGLLDGGGLGVHRKLYYRELIARFGHHRALNWNIGEENGEGANNPETPPQGTSARLAVARYFHDHDPYKHPIVVHNGASFNDLLTPASKYTGVSIQYPILDGHKWTLAWLKKSEAAGIAWTVCHDEQGSADDGVLPDASTKDDHAAARIGTLWGNLMAGGAGVEYYFGYKHPHSDLTCQDFRSRDRLWDQSRYALDFFRKNAIPFWEMTCDDGLSSNKDDYCFFAAGRVYVVYMKKGGTTELDLKGTAGRFEAKWYDPRNSVFTGSPWFVEGGGMVELGPPPRDTSLDWVLLLRKG